MSWFQAILTDNWGAGPRTVGRLLTSEIGGDIPGLDPYQVSATFFGETPLSNMRVDSGLIKFA